MNTLGLVLVLSMSACGGGADAGGTASLASISGTRMKALDASGASDATWTACATEGQYCTFSGIQQVRYGAGTQFVTQNLSGGTPCTNAVFGDPDYGYVKSCSYMAVAAGSSPVWVLCASESQTCTFSGTRQVRYGTPTQNVIGTFTSQTVCSNAVFGDPAYGIVKSCWYAATVAAPAGATGTNPPIIFNSSTSGRPGDVVSLQGVNFGSAPVVYFDGAPGTPLQIVNSVGTSWLAVQIPANAQGALILRVGNGTGVSAQVFLNAALALHLDAVQLSPGGAFRVFGRNLLLPGSTPTVTVNGAAAALNLAQSNEYMLTAVAPATLSASAAATIVVDNGNGSGPATLDRTIQTLATGSGDPFAIGAGWASAFSAISGTSVNAATDPRLPQKPACDGKTDDSYAIQTAIDLAASLGGGVVQLPSGQCRLVGRFNLESNVVVQGAGIGSTVLIYDSNYAFSGLNIDLAGIRNLTMTNSGVAVEGPLLKNSTRVFIQNVQFLLGANSNQMYLTGNVHFAVQNCNFVQGGSNSDQGPYTFTVTTGLIFENNTTQWAVGAPTFGQVHDSYIHANTFTRDGRAQNLAGTVHSLTLDFAYRVAVLGNTFNVAYGPITNMTRNDGETILTEGGGTQRTENLGNVASATSTTVTDPNNTIAVDPFGTGVIPEDYGVAIVGGTGAGQTRRLTAYSQPTMTVDHPWDVIPDSTSVYATFVFGLEKSLLKDNTFSQNPRGIWLYQTAIRDVDVIGNSFSEGGGIYLRSYQDLSTKSFMPIYNVLIARNNVVNTTGLWMSYINSVFVNTDARSFGIATLGVEMRSNQLTANIPNVSSNTEDYASLEGYMNMMRVESSASYQSSVMPRMLGTILANNTCTNCAVAVRIGTGAGGTTILGTVLVNSSVLLNDWATTSTTETSTGTVVH